MNRARVDPQVEMAACGSRCPEAACYGPQPPLGWAEALNHAARFHSAHLAKEVYLAHNSSCTVVSNINQLFPGSCDGSSSCACVGGVNACNPTCTTWSQRIALFGASGGAEVIASLGDPNGAFDWYARAVKIDSRNEDSLGAFERLASTTGQWPAVAKLYEGELESLGDEPERR